ncbi:hypothetical protein RUM43_008090 [Polyplax serrata]|uniref:Uncharacterized protein n=1 Tax=Polyplax serrata TaxID=468196 RepID=A0AAN8PA15_POLSC
MKMMMNCTKIKVKISDDRIKNQMIKRQTRQGTNTDECIKRVESVRGRTSVTIQTRRRRRNNRPIDQEKRHNNSESFADEEMCNGRRYITRFTNH